MKRKILSLALAILLAASLAACAGEDEPVIREPSAPVITDSAPTEDSPSIPESTPEATEDTGYYANKVYYVGADIPAGGYIVTCTGTDYGMDVLVFTGEQEFAAYQKAEKFTNGEFWRAVEENAWADFYLKTEEQGYLGLREGNVLLLDGGKCEFTRCDLSAENILYPGTYAVGEDLDSRKADLVCVSKHLRITLFESGDAYLAYHKSSRFTGGDEDAAIEQNALSSEYVYQDKHTSLDLRPGMVMMIGDGTGKLITDSGPVIH